MFVEYISVDKRLAEDLNEILSLGKNSDDIVEGILQRALGLRKFLNKWEHHVSSNLIRVIKDIIQISKMHDTEKPTLPDPGAFDTASGEGFAALWTEVIEMWNSLIGFYENNLNRGEMGRPRQPIDRFVEMSDQLEKTLIAVKPETYKLVEFNEIKYTFVSTNNWSGRLIASIDDLKAMEHFSTLAERTKHALENLPRWKTYETLEQVKNTKIKRADLEKESSTIIELVEKEDVKILNENEILYGRNKIVPACRVNGRRVPAPDKEDGTYSKTFLNNMKREHLIPIGSQYKDIDSAMKRLAIVDIITNNQKPLKMVV